MESLSQDHVHSLFSRAKNTSLSTLLLLVVITYFAYWGCIYIYRITLHPLARFPGPKLAAISFWYEFWYDVWPNDSKYLWKIKELHEKYGPIIRMNPYCLHIDDVDFYDNIYAGHGRRRDRDNWWMPGMNTSVPMAGSMFMAEKHDQHRQRRAAVGEYFSMRSIRALEPLVNEKIDIVMRRLGEEYSNGTIVNISDVNSGLSLDVISAYCFGDGVQALNKPEYGSTWRKMLITSARANAFGRQFPAIHMFLQTMPPWLLVKMDPLLGELMAWTRNAAQTIADVLAGKEVLDTQHGHRTIFHEIKDSDLPPTEKTPSRLMGEAYVFIGAGTETTARNLTILDYHLLANPDLQARLFQELKQVMPRVDSPVKIDELLRLPYLTACINEAMRLSHGVGGRSPRVAPDEDLHYNGWVIPRGTAMTESPYLIHSNPDIYPEPFKFNPQRWIDDPQLVKKFIPFGRGTRPCLGQNLARCEVYSTTARLFRRFRMELYDTTYERDIRIEHDDFICLPTRGSRGVRVRVVGEHKD